MKKIIGIVLLLCAVLLMPSCDKTTSYTDMLKAEKKAIERLMDDEGFVVLKKYPADGVFKENEFYKMDNGVYLNVIDSGNGERATSNSTIVVCRFKAWLFKSDTTDYNGFLSSQFPVTFKYGVNQPITDDRSYTALDYFVCDGLASGLDYVGDSSVVKLIVPFKVASSSFQNSGDPIYFERVRYIFDKK